MSKYASLRIAHEKTRRLNWKLKGRKLLLNRHKLSLTKQKNP